MTSATTPFPPSTALPFSATIVPLWQLFLQSPSPAFRLPRSLRRRKENTTPSTTVGGGGGHELGHCGRGSGMSCLICFTDWTSICVGVRLFHSCDFPMRLMKSRKMFRWLKVFGEFGTQFACCKIIHLWKVAKTLALVDGNSPRTKRETVTARMAAGAVSGWATATARDHWQLSPAWPGPHAHR